MSKAGQNAIKGFNAQTLRAMSLFLQFLRDPKFSYIQLEASKFEDFNLVFDDGRKIICESKDWKRGFSFPDLKKVLVSILKKNVLGKNDEILIVCANLNSKLEYKIDTAKYFKEAAEEFKTSGFSRKQIDVLPQVKFWKVPKDFNEKIIYSLFSELINFWLPGKDIQRIVNDILFEKIYKGSEKGAVFSRNDIISEIEHLKQEVIQKSGYLDKERSEMEKILAVLGIALNDNKSPTWSASQIAALSAQPDLMFFVVDRLKNKKIDRLSDWKNLWQLNRQYGFSFAVFNIFENNLQTLENKKYVLDFINSNIGVISGFYRHDFFDISAVKIISKIVDNNKDILTEAFEIIKKSIEIRDKDYFYLEINNNDEWRRGEICKLLKKIYDSADEQLRNKIYNLVSVDFNLIKDEGQFSHYTPQEIFWILRDWLNSDFENRLLVLTAVLSNQYDQYYKNYNKKLKFDGWERMGSTTSFSGHSYIVSDRHFVLYTVEPSLRKYYEESNDKKHAWEFILTNCITKTGEVGKTRPDFLNRASVFILLNRYESDDKKISEEAFKILKEFVLSMGIPRKSDLIYQALRGNGSLSQDKKWNLIKIGTKKDGVPVNVFVEEIVSQLAKAGHEEAKQEIRNWLKNPKYYGKSRFEINIIQNIRTVLDSDFNYATKMLEDFINSEYFIYKYDDLETYEVAILLQDILKRDPERVLYILRDLIKKKTLTKNQQIILGFSLFNLRGNDESDSLELLEMVYQEFINPFFNSLGKNDYEVSKEIYKKMPYSHAREAFVQFAVRLAHYKKINEALRIVRIFINDPDPYLPSEDPEDREGEYNEHKVIEENGEEPHATSSVRGLCAWVLMKCVILDGRDYIPEIIDLTEQLTKDKNYYVKHMACFALSQLAQNRLTVLPENRNILFFNDNQRKALEMAKRVEQIAFNLLNDIAKSPPNVQKALARSILIVFNHIKALNENNALSFLNIIKEFPKEVISEAAPLFIYYAEFRKTAFKDWRWTMPGLYDDLSPDKYDDQKFKKILIDILSKISPEQRYSFVVQFEQLVRNNDFKSEEDKRNFNIAYKYFKRMSDVYEREVFSVIYKAIEENMEKNTNFDKWYQLLKTCLNKEKEFYCDSLKPDKAGEMHWWHYYDSGELLSIVYKYGGNERFLEILDIITSFPKEIVFNITDEAVALLQNFPKANNRVKTIIDFLFQRNPSKYYELKNQWS